MKLTQTPLNSRKRDVIPNPLQRVRDPLFALPKPQSLVKYRDKTPFPVFARELLAPISRHRPTRLN